MGVFEEYFIRPIIEKTGYNMVNTLAYASIAIAALYLIYRWMEKKAVKLTWEFWVALAGFVAFGSSIRVVTDSIDAGVMGSFVQSASAGALAPIYSAVLQSHALDYGYWTVTPGIYIVTAVLFFATMLLGNAYGGGKFAARVAWIFASLPMLLLLPMATHFDYAAAIVALALVAALGAKHLLKFSFKQTLPVFGHALDGAATWIAIDFFGPARGVAYFEQHVLSNGIGTATPLGFGLFFLLKVAFSSAAVYYLSKDGEREGIPPLAVELSLAAIMVLGLAPGLRDMLRLLLGT